MEAYLFEILLTRGWRRGGEIYWTLDDAKRQAGAMVKQKIARRVRILPVEVGLQPVAELGAPTSSRPSPSNLGDASPDSPGRG